MDKIEFLNLGNQPIANGFLNKKDFSKEFFYNLSVIFDEKTKLVSLKNFVKPEMMFNENYIYQSSGSEVMRNHFKDIANKIKKNFNHKKILEIGSNDSVFIKYFDKENSICVEPCNTFAEITNNLGYKTYSEFWNYNLSERIKNEHGKFDVIYAANCMCHIQNINESFKSINNILTDNGIFIFEDPSLVEMLNRYSYDQIYDEHAHIFSVTSLKNLLMQNKLEIFKVENLLVHGGSNRIYVKKTDNKDIKIDKSVENNLKFEDIIGIKNKKIYFKFAERIKYYKKDLFDLLYKIKNKKEKIISYGATSKSTTIFNYCNINNSLIDCIIDTTPDKQGKYSPGVHIPVVSPEKGFTFDIKYVFLSAWNYMDYIINKEKDFVNRGGKFITHVPIVRFV